MASMSASAPGSRRRSTRISGLGQRMTAIARQFDVRPADVDRHDRVRPDRAVRLRLRDEANRAGQERDGGIDGGLRTEPLADDVAIADRAVADETDAIVRRERVAPRI